MNDQGVDEHFRVELLQLLRECQRFGLEPKRVLRVISEFMVMVIADGLTTEGPATEPGLSDEDTTV